MRLRTAIKIQRFVEDWDLGRWKNATVWESRRICRRKWKDHRLPYIPSDDELNERVLLGMSILADALIENDNEREAFKEAIWT